MKVSKMRHSVTHLSFREAIKQTIKRPRSLFQIRQLQTARQAMHRAPQLHKEFPNRLSRVAIGYDPLCAAHWDLSLPLAALGEVESAARHTALALQRAQKLGQPLGVA